MSRNPAPATPSLSLTERIASLVLSSQARLSRIVGGGLLGIRDNADEIDPGSAKNILIVRLDEIGDMVMFSPFLREIRRLAPHAHITLVAKPAVLNLFEHCPYVDEIVLFDQQVRKWLRPVVLMWRSITLSARRLRSRRYDMAVLPRWDADNSYATFLAYFSGARQRIGYSETVTPARRVLNRGFDRLLTHPIPGGEVAHEVERSLDVIRFLGGRPQERLEVWPGAEDEDFARQALADGGIGPDDRIVALCPSSGHSILKQWPLENFVELGRRIVEKYPARILLVGGPGEEAMSRRIAEPLGARAVDMTGKTTLRQMSALLRRSHVYVGNDTGPSHIAAAAGARVVSIFGSSCTHRFRPWSETGVNIALDLPCNPCNQGHRIDRCRSCIYDAPKCLTEITVERVFQAVENQLREMELQGAATAKG